MYYFQALLVALEELDVNIHFTAANMTVSLQEVLSTQKADFPKSQWIYLEFTIVA